MSSPTYNTVQVPPSKQEVAWGIETVAAGTAATSFTVEPCKPSLALMSDMYTAEEYFGSGVKKTDWIEMTHHAELTLTGDVRADGLAPQALVSMLGDLTNAGASETVSGSGPYTHTVSGGAKGVRCVTYSMPYQTGSGDVLHLTYLTLDTLKLTWAYNNPLKYEAKLIGYFPTADTTMPSASQLTNFNRLLNPNATFNLIANSGVAYASKPLSGSITFSRAVKPDFSASNPGKNPIDIYCDVLDMKIDTIDFLYQGIGSGGTPYYDFLNKLAWGGSAGSPSSITWGDGTRSLSVKWWTARWSDLKHQEQNNTVHLTGSAETWHDIGAATGGTPALSAPSQVVIVNDVSGAMVY